MIAIYQENMLIQTKFQPPDFGSLLIKRKRLFDILNENEHCKLIMVTAPAGYGKTALLSSWLITRVKKQKVTWFAADEEDNDEELFFRYFMMSFYRNAWVPEEMKQKANTIFGNAIPFSKLQLIHFVNDIARLGVQFTMVLDDLGVISNQSIIHQLEYLIHHLPSNVQLILSGRKSLDMSLAKYKVSGEVLELTAAELSFNREETISFFRNAVHCNLSWEEYEEISNSLEGWAAGMQLMALTADKAGKRSVPLYAGNHLIYTYLMEEVIGGLDDKLKGFLIETAAFNRFCPRLCNFVFETNEAGEIIHSLENLNVFLSCIDQKEGWFRYHRLFRDFLQTLIPEEEAEHRLSLYRKTSEWHEAENNWQEAIHYAIKGQDFGKAVSLMEALSMEIGCRGNSRLLHQWNQCLPKELVDHNLRLLLNSAWAYSSEGNMVSLFACLKDIRRFETIPLHLQAEITALYSSNIAGPDAALDTILLECRRALKLLTPKEFLMQLLYFNIGSILLLKGDVKESLFYYEQCYQNSRQAGNAYLSVVSKKAMITFRIRNGQLQTAEQEIFIFLKELADIGGEALPAAGLLYAQLAEIYYLRNELADALDMAVKGSRYGELGKDMWTSGENYLILEKIYWAMNDRKQYEGMQTKALMCVEGRKFFDLSFKLECNHIQALISEGKLTSASRRISSLEAITDTSLCLVYPEFTFVKAGFYIKKGKFKKAEERLLALKKAAAFNEQKGLLCEIQVLLSTIYEKMGAATQALDELEAAVSLAGEQGNYQFFLNEGELMAGMLKRLVTRRNTKINQTIFVEGLLCSFETQAAGNELPAEILSSREIEILNMVAQGVGNEEIADKLFVSKNTVKTHLLNIYSKLNVHSRTKAVSKAEALKIISFHCREGES